MTPTRSGSPTGSTGSDADVHTRSRTRTVPPSDLEPDPGPTMFGTAVRPAPGTVPARSDPDQSAAPTRDQASSPSPDQPAPPTGVQPARPEERRALRAARRRRQQLGVACAVLVAFCLGVTILIVVMAGNRTPSPQVVTARPTAAPAPAVTFAVVPGTAVVVPRGRA